MQVDSYGWLMNNTWDGAMALYARNKVDLMMHGTSMRYACYLCSYVLNNRITLRLN